MALPPPQRITVPGTSTPEITMSVLDTGGDGSPVVLLHGWPDRATLWTHQIEVLAAAGHRVIAPDLRGFGDSDRPVGVEHYATTTLVADVLGLADALGVGSFALAGHDWGAAVGWGLTLSSPRVTRYAALSVGHPGAVSAAGFAQKQLSWYMLWFQAPGVAERVLPVDDWRMFREWAHATAPADDALVAQQIADLGRPGALTATLNLYRANTSVESYVRTEPVKAPPATVPVLGVWSDRDFALTGDQMRETARHAPDFRFEVVEGCGHWFPHEAPERTAELLAEFFAAS